MWSLTYFKPINNLDKLKNFQKNLAFIQFSSLINEAKAVGRFPEYQEIVFSQTNETYLCV